MGNVGAHLDALPGGRDGRVHPEPARLELDDGHADVGGDADESQRLLLLEQPYAALHRLMDRRERERVKKNGDFFSRRTAAKQKRRGSGASGSLPQCGWCGG
jgi:hypothetical protein